MNLFTDAIRAAEQIELAYRAAGLTLEPAVPTQPFQEYKNYNEYRPASSYQRNVQQPSTSRPNTSPQQEFQRSPQRTPTPSESTEEDRMRTIMRRITFKNPRIDSVKETPHGRMYYDSRTEPPRHHEPDLSRQLLKSNLKPIDSHESKFSNFQRYAGNTPPRYPKRPGFVRKDPLVTLEGYKRKSDGFIEPRTPPGYLRSNSPNSPSTSNFRGSQFGRNSPNMNQQSFRQSSSNYPIRQSSPNANERSNYQTSPNYNYTRDRSNEINRPKNNYHQSRDWNRNLQHDSRSNDSRRTPSRERQRYPRNRSRSSTRKRFNNNYRFTKYSQQRTPSRDYPPRNRSRDRYNSDYSSTSREQSPYYQRQQPSSNSKRSTAYSSQTANQHPGVVQKSETTKTMKRLKLAQSISSNHCQELEPNGRPPITAVKI